MDHNVQTWQVRPTLPRTHEEVVIPETRSPKDPPEPPTSHLPLPGLLSTSQHGLGGRGPGWAEGFLSTPGSWSEPASRAAERGWGMPSHCARAHTRAHTAGPCSLPGPQSSERPLLSDLWGGSQDRTSHQPQLHPPQAIRGPSRPPHTVPHPPQQVSWLPLSWGELLGTHPPHQLGAPEAWAWPV